MTVLQDAINKYTNGVIQDLRYLQMKGTGEKR
jgi:hypothetical protein